MQGQRFKLTRSRRLCAKGHTNTFEIEGVDEASQEWLADWTLYCHTCKALTLDFAEAKAARHQDQSESTVGFIVQMPVDMEIVKARRAP